MKWYQDTLQAVQTPIPNFIVMISPFIRWMINSCVLQCVFLLSRCAEGFAKNKPRTTLYCIMQALFMQVRGKPTLSVCFRWSQPAPPKGELFAIFRSARIKLPLRGQISPGRGKMSPQVTKGGIWHAVRRD